MIKNNIGQIENVYSQDGKTNFYEYDFKNNVLSLKKRFAIDYQNVLDWNETVPLQSEELEFVEQTTYDALNRPITRTQPDTTVASYVYNKGGLLEKVLHGATEYISNINYNEKGQRSKISYGNNTQTLYTYNPMNFRLTNIYTKRNSDSNALQDLNFTFDAVGNIVEQTDNAQQTYYYSNQVIAPNAKYTYDPLYRLINATGRELTNLVAPNHNDFTSIIGIPAANAMQTYNHTYEFDELGNMQSDNWKDYVYDTDTNRLLKHDPDQTLNDYTYDVHGNMLTMPHLTSMVWDFADRLQSAGNGTFTSYYNYDLEGNRSRKVVVKSNIREERYYLGDYEIYRKYVNDTKTLERSTVHIIDDRDRFAMIETETGNTPVVRYQYNNHLGSACLELDTTAQIISYEEYHPYGTTSYRSGRTETEVSLKRYKYVGKERDEETGLYYYGARYYAAWLCRFVSVDPLQFKYPYYTPYQYAGNKPIRYIDLDGLEEASFESYQAKYMDWGTNLNSPTPNIGVTLLPGDVLAGAEYILDHVFDAGWWASMIGYDNIIQGMGNYEQNEQNYNSDNSSLPLDQIPADVQKVNYTMAKWNSVAQTTEGLTTFYSACLNTATTVVGGAEMLFTARTLVTTTVAENVMPLQRLNILSSENAIVESAALEAQKASVNVVVQTGIEVEAKGGTLSTALVTKYPAIPEVTGTAERMFLMPEQVIDRYGALGGKWFSTPETSFGARSIPPGTSPYTQFKVLKPFEVQKSLASPGMFSGQTGFGIQFQSPVGADILIKRGIITLTK